MSVDTAASHWRHIDTAIIGNGPSSLILSYILNGNIPYYSGSHCDDNVDRCLSQSVDLLHIDHSLFDHIRSSLSYSSQALPINVILDTLQRPGGDVTDARTSHIKWLSDPSKAIDHVVLGEAPRAGGQWVENPVWTTWSIGTLSYAEQLSLPGFSFADYWKQAHSKDLPDFVRPSRSDVASYYATYPAAVGIESRILTLAKVAGVSRAGEGFRIASHSLTCNNLVLATGTFSINLPPPRSLSLISTAQVEQGPVLVIGSGFTAADLIISTPPSRKIIHVYNWNPENRPSPLQGCHSQAYPEYAWIYGQMKLAAARQGQEKGKLRTPKFKTVPALPHFNDRDWNEGYEGYANAEVFSLKQPNEPVRTATETTSPTGTARQRTVIIRLPGSDTPVEREVSTLHYATGRRGSLGYLSEPLLHEVLDTSALAQSMDADPWNGPADSRPVSRGSADALNNPHRADVSVVSGSTLRPKLDERGGMRVARHVYVVGSLTGDSLVRFALGGCCDVAGCIHDRRAAASLLPREQAGDAAVDQRDAVSAPAPDQQVGHDTAVSSASTTPDKASEEGPVRPSQEDRRRQRRKAGPDASRTVSSRSHPCFCL